MGGALKTDVRTGMNASPSMMRQLLEGEEIKNWKLCLLHLHTRPQCVTLPVRGSKGREEQSQNCSESGVFLCGGVQPHQ